MPRQLFTAVRKVRLTFSKNGLAFLVRRIPSMVFWATVCTGLLISLQYIYYHAMPAKNFIDYSRIAEVKDTKLGEEIQLTYCRVANGTYNVIIRAEVERQEPPVFTEHYIIDTTVPQGNSCITRVVERMPDVPGKYKVKFFISVKLPLGAEKFTYLESNVFKVG